MTGTLDAKWVNYRQDLSACLRSTGAVIGSYKNGARGRARAARGRGAGARGAPRAQTTALAFFDAAVGVTCGRRQWPVHFHYRP